MKANFIIFSALLCAVLGSPAFNDNVVSREKEEWEDNKLLEDIDVNILRELRGIRQQVRQRGCLLNMCFALQGDKFITGAQFRAQKNFVELIVSLTATDQKANFCAVQYSRTTTPISKLTKKRNKFLNKVQDATQRGSNSTNISAALAYSAFQLRAQRNQPRKIVLLGDGFYNVGGGPIATAKTVREDGTEFCAVAVGDFKDRRVLAQITGDPNRVLNVNDFFNLGEIAAAIVNNVCNFYFE